MRTLLVFLLLLPGSFSCVGQMANMLDPNSAGKLYRIAALHDGTEAVQSSQAARPARKQIKDPAEYGSYVSALQQSNPVQKAAALDSFVQTYRNSVVQEDALELLMVTYQQLGDVQKALDAANRVLLVNPNNIRAFALLAYNYRAAAAQGGPLMQDSLAKAQQYGERGLQALQNMQKPEGMSDADFAKLHNETTAIFEGAIGFAALQAKEFATAQKHFRQAVSQETSPSVNDIYPLAIADLEAKPLNPEGFWLVVKAANLAGPGQQQILDYGTKAYINYHGSEQGWNELVNDARAGSSTIPPQGFTVAAGPPPSLPVQASDIANGNPGFSQVSSIFGYNPSPSSCSAVNQSVKAESKMASGQGSCPGEVDAWLTNVSTQKVTCTVIFHRKGIWDKSSKLAVTLSPGEKLGGFLSPGGIWTCGADSPTALYICFPDEQDLSHSCNARVQWDGAPPPSQGIAQRQPQTGQPPAQQPCPYKGCTTH